MPKKIEKKLENEADKKGLKGTRRNRYVYGTLNKIESKSKRKTVTRKK
jgi:hypothetical protein